MSNTFEPNVGSIGLMSDDSNANLGIPELAEESALAPMQIEDEIEVGLLDEVDGISSRDELVGAIDNASEGDVITLASDFSYQDNILIDKSVTIEGNGVILDHNVRTSGDFAEFTPAFIVGADNVTIRDLTINGSNRDGSNALIELDNKGSTRSRDFTLSNVTLQNATAGLRNRGILPSDLSVQDSTFYNTNKAIDLARDASMSDFTPQSSGFSNAADDPIFFQDAGSLNISNNRIFVDEGQPDMQIGIQIDAGNDGFNTNPAPGFVDNTLENRGDNNNLVTNYTNAVIANNTGQSASDPISATEFPIALAKVANVMVEDNLVETVGNAGKQLDFSSGINVEHSSRDVTIQNNDIAVNRAVDGEQNNQGISVLPFHDHGSAANSEEATVGVKILNNTISGSGRSGIFGYAFKDLEIDGNSLDQFSKSRDNLAKIGLFSTDDNGNGVLNADELSSLGSISGVESSNLGADGLVTDTLFNTKDPTDLPTHMR